MKKIFAVLKVVAVGVFALGVTGCGLMPPKERVVHFGTVMRATVIAQHSDTTRMGTVNPEQNASVHFDLVRDAGMRMGKVQYGEGWDMGIVTVLVPDQIEFSQLSKGTVVDVMVEFPANANYDTSTLHRILRIVCDSKDDKCIDAEKEAKRYKTFVDKNPPKDISAQFGVTYNRRMSLEELAMYK